MDKIFRTLILLFLFTSCVIPKEARILKRTTGEWRESPLVMSGYLDTPFSGLFLNIRENGKFERISSGMFEGFEAGSWEYSNDTLILTYVDHKQKPLNSEKVIIDKKTSTLIFVGDSTNAMMRLRVTIY